MTAFAVTPVEPVLQSALLGVAPDSSQKLGAVHGTRSYSGVRNHAAAREPIAGTQRTRVAAETLRDWMQHYRRGGFDALYPKRRADLGRPRRLAPEVAELLIALKTEHVLVAGRTVAGTDRRRRAARAQDGAAAPARIHQASVMNLK